MTTLSSIIDTAVPVILILIVLGWVWGKFGDGIKKLISNIADWIKGSSGKKNKNEFQYIDYGGG